MSQTESENVESENLVRRDTVEGLTDILMDHFPVQIQSRRMGLRSQFPSVVWMVVLVIRGCSGPS